MPITRAMSVNLASVVALPPNGAVLEQVTPDAEARAQVHRQLRDVPARERDAPGVGAHEDRRGLPLIRLAARVRGRGVLRPPPTPRP